MLHIASQTAGPIGLKFFVDTHGWPRGCYRLKKIQIFFHGPSASNKYKRRCVLRCLMKYLQLYGLKDD